MKKSLLALAVLGTFAGAAVAESSVTLYGRVDLSVARNMGSDANQMQNGSGSRVGLRGAEDLGGGMAAVFTIEHRFNADTGAQSDADQFWNGRSYVGLKGGFGQIVFGREYTPAFLGAMLLIDPWGWDTVANGAALTGLGISNVRNDSSATYWISGGGFSFGAQIAEGTDTIAVHQSKPVSFVANYAGGPLWAAFGYEKTGDEDATGSSEKMWIAAISYNFGAFKPGFSYAKGDSAAGAETSAWYLNASAPLGAGQFRVGYGQLEAADVDVSSRFTIGYHYSLSKRTTLYVDFANDSERVTDKSAYDFGIKHNF